MKNLKGAVGWKQLRTPVLTIAGFAFLCAAAFTVAIVAGLAAVGVSLLVLEWLSED